MNVTEYHSLFKLADDKQGIFGWDLFESLCEDQTNFWDLRTFYERYFEDNFETAMENFVKSYASFQIQFYVFKTYDVNIDRIMFFRDGSYANVDIDLYFYPYLDTDDHII